MTEFNPEWELRKLSEMDARRGGRKMSFARQCAAFAALYEGIAPKVVGFAFRISPQTVSYISGCLQQDPDPYREEYATGKRADGTFHNPDLEAPRRVPHDHNGRRNPNRYRRYETVAREFEALGREEFIRRYMTPEVIERLTAARKRLANNARPFNPSDDAEPNFERMNSEQTFAWRLANPAKYRELFPEHFTNGNDGFYGEK